MSVTEFCSAAAKSILDALGRGNDDHRNSDPEFDNLAELTVRVIRFEDGAEIANMMGVVEGIRREAAHRQSPFLAAHLAMVSRVLAAAARRRLPLPNGLADSDRLILSKLGAGPLSGRAIAAATGLTVETVARRLPRLRAAGLVDSWKEGRQTTNSRTAAGGDAIRSSSVPRTVAADPGPTVNHDLRKVVRKQALTVPTS